MRYPQFYDMYRDAIRNTWTVEEIDFSDDLVDLQRKLLPAERHLINRLVAFFATGDSIVSNNLVLNLYKHINAPEARMYLSRQLYEEALHVQFYLTLLDTYIPDHDERAEAVRRHREHPVHPRARPSSASSGSTRSTASTSCAPVRTASSSCSTSSASPPASRGCSSSAPSPTSTSCAPRACSTAWPPAPTGCSATRACHMNFAFEVIDQVRARGARPLRRRRCAARVRGDDRRGRRRASTRFAEDLLSEGVAGLSLSRHARVPAVRRRPAPDDPRPAQALRLEEPVRLHGAPGRAGADQLLRAHRVRPTRSASTARSPSTRTSSRRDRDPQDRGPCLPTRRPERVDQGRRSWASDSDTFSGEPSRAASG